MFLPAFGTFLSVVSAFVMSHKPNLRPVLEREQSNQLRSADMTRQTAKGKGSTVISQQNSADSLLAPSCPSYRANHFGSRILALVCARATTVLTGDILPGLE